MKARVKQALAHRAEHLEAEIAEWRTREINAFPSNPDGHNKAMKLLDATEKQLRSMMVGGVHETYEPWHALIARALWGSQFVKIDAIRVVRVATRMGLADAKHTIEVVVKHFDPTQTVGLPPSADSVVAHRQEQLIISLKLLQPLWTKPE